MESLQSIIASLEDLFSKFNDYLFSGELQKPIIAVSPDTTKGAYGWCTGWKAWNRGGDDADGYYEINMCAEYLNRSFPEVCTTLIHEMVHLWNLQNKVKDTSRSGLYHNKQFKVEAELHGLVVEKTDKYGYSKTTLNEETLEYVNSLDATTFDLVRTKGRKKLGSRSSSRKYICPMCGLSVRATKEVNIRCVDCDADMTDEF